MNTIDKLLSIQKTLLGPSGCPWDKKQKVKDMPLYLMEEVHELIEAIENKDIDHMIEEAGDVLHALLFFVNLAENESLFTLKQVVETVCEKLIFRHPHIFGDEKVKNAEEVLKIWNKRKQEEKNRKTPFEGIPNTLPALARAQKVVHKLELSLKEKRSLSEEEVGEKLLELVMIAEKEGFQAEGALRKALSKIEKAHM